MLRGREIPDMDEIVDVTEYPILFCCFGISSILRLTPLLVLRWLLLPAGANASSFKWQEKSKHL